MQLLCELLVHQFLALFRYDFISIRSVFSIKLPARLLCFLRPFVICIIDVLFQALKRNRLANAVERDIHRFSVQISRRILLLIDLTHAEGIRILADLGNAQLLLDALIGAADIDAVPGVGLIREAADIDLDTVAGLDILARAGAYQRVAELVADAFRHFLGGLINILFGKAQVNAAAAICNGHAARQRTDIHLFRKVKGSDAACRQCCTVERTRKFAQKLRIRHISGILRRCCKLLDVVDRNFAVGTPGSADGRRIRAQHGIFHRVVEKAHTGQVGARGIGGILPIQVYHLIHNAAHRVLLPLHPGLLLLEALDLLLITGNRVFNQSFGIQAARKAADYVSIAVNTACAAGATQAADRCHIKPLLYYTHFFL